MVENLVGTSHDLTLDFTPDPAGGIASTTRSNDTYAWIGHYGVNRSYTGDGTRTYTYDIENRLVASSSGAALVYDPLGRLYEVSAGGVTRRFVYDPGSGSGAGGDAIIHEVGITVTVHQLSSDRLDPSL